MDDWNFDISKAPRGKTEMRERTYMVQGTEQIRAYEEFVPEPVIPFTKCRKVVRSHWTPEVGKYGAHWHWLAVGEQPIAWMPWPKPPVINAEEEHV